MGTGGKGDSIFIVEHQILMKDIIAPVPKELLKAELTEEKRLRFTHRSDNEIYIVTAFDSPNVMREIGRLREIAFRAAAGVQAKRLTLTNSTQWRTPTDSLSYGTLIAMTS